MKVDGKLIDEPIVAGAKVICHVSTFISALSLALGTPLAKCNSRSGVARRT